MFCADGGGGVKEELLSFFQSITMKWTLVAFDHKSVS